MAGPARHILVVSHTGRRDSIDAALSVCAQLAEADVHLVLTADEKADILPFAPEMDGVAVLGEDVQTADLEIVIVLGGDGTILRSAEIVRGTSVPLLGVNLGHVGFLAESEREDLTATVRRVLDRDYTVEERMTLDVTLKVGADIV